MTVNNTFTNSKNYDKFKKKNEKIYKITRRNGITSRIVSSKS